MNITILRSHFTELCTTGALLINDEFECYTLEDTVRPAGVKIAGATAIPFGEYEVTIDHSTRFNRLMPHVLRVPMFEGIRIHSGNTSADTEGCILIGRTRDENSIGESRLAFDAFFCETRSGFGTWKGNLDDQAGSITILAIHTLLGIAHFALHT